MALICWVVPTPRLELAGVIAIDTSVIGTGGATPSSPPPLQLTNVRGKTAKNKNTQELFEKISFIDISLIAKVLLLILPKIIRKIDVRFPIILLLLFLYVLYVLYSFEIRILRPYNRFMSMVSGEYNTVRKVFKASALIEEVHVPPFSLIMVVSIPFRNPRIS